LSWGSLEEEKEKMSCLKLLECSFCGENYSVDKAMVILEDRAPNILYLDISNNNTNELTGIGITILANRYKLLQSLSLSGNNITDTHVETVATNCQQLEVFNISNCGLLAKGETIFTILENLHFLQKLYLSYCEQICFSLSDAYLSLIRTKHKKWPHLQLLYLNGLKLEDNVFEVITELAPNLQTLTLGRVNTLKYSLISMPKNLPDLQLLDLSGTCTNKQVLLEIAKYCKSLLNLTLSAVTGDIDDSTCIKVLESCYWIQTICLPGCAQITDRFLEKLLEIEVPYLEKVIVSGCSINKATISRISNLKKFVIQ